MPSLRAIELKTLRSLHDGKAYFGVKLLVKKENHAVRKTILQPELYLRPKSISLPFDSQIALE